MSQSTRETIIQTAVELFMEHGFDRVTIGDICAKCGVNKTTFYYYFESKDALLQDYYVLRNDITTQMLSILVSEENPVEQLWQIFACGIEFFTSSGWQIMKQIYVLNLTKDIRSFRLTQQKVEVFSVMKTVLIKAQAAKMVNNQSDPKSLLTILVQMTYGLTYSWCARKGSFDLPQMTRAFFEHILDVSEDCRKQANIPPSQMWYDLAGGTALTGENTTQTSDKPNTSKKKRT